MAGKDYAKLTSVLEGENPAGVNLRDDETLIEVYRTIKDARSAARSQDRSMENPYVVDGDQEDVSDKVAQPSKKWREVHDLCYEQLTTSTKDIELLSWLIESVPRVHGLGELAGVVAATRELLTNHFEHLHCPDDETLADKVGSLAGLNGGGDSDGTLIRPLYLMSLAPDEIFGRFNLWEFAQANRNGDGMKLAGFQETFNSADAEAFAELKAQASDCLENVEAIDAVLKEKCQSEAPSLRRIREVLEEVCSAFKDLSAYVTVPQDAKPTEKDDNDLQVTSGLNGSATPVATGAIQNREQAFQSMLQIASFFRRTEPHSSIPFALETLVRRGRMDFMGLLCELVPDENTRRDVLVRAGIEPNSTNDIQSE